MRRKMRKKVTKGITKITSEVKSLSENAREWIGNFLYHEGFQTCDHTQEGILRIVDSLQSYSEEGHVLYPEIVITPNLEKVLKTLPTFRKIAIGAEKLEAEAFTLALKKCATLAKNGWIIYIEPQKSKIEYGVINTRTSELSPSVYRHIVGDLALRDLSIPIAYLRNYGSNAVEIKGSHKSLVISLSLSSKYRANVDELEKFSQKALEDLNKSCSKELIDQVSAFLRSLLEDVIRESHGCLLAVLKDDKASLRKFTKKYRDGLYLPKPIDLVSLVNELITTQNIESSLYLAAYRTVAREMIAYDGITILSNTGKIIAYNLFVEKPKIQDQSKSGGARHRAFQALKDSAFIECALICSHDGKIEFGEKNHVE